MKSQLFALAVTMGVAFACSSNKGFADHPGDGGNASDASEELVFGEGGITGSCCSPDTRNVIDCHTNAVLTTCPADQACGNGACIPACDAAKTNKSSIGCDFYSVDPGSAPEAAGGCFAAYVANTWTTDVTLTASYNGATLDISNLARIPSGSGSSITYSPLPGGKLPAGQMAILFLADWVSADPNTQYDITHCPAGITPGYTTSEASLQVTGISHAFHITSSAPVVAYDIFPYGGLTSYISSATLLLPTSVWDTNYVAVDAYAAPADPGNGRPFIQVVASEPGTTITINPTAAIVGGNNVAPAPQGSPQTYSLSVGDVLQIMQYDELNGSPILSNKPIGVWGGHSCMQIDPTDGDCDSGHQELFPVNAMGNEYVAVKHKNRTAYDEQPPWRFVGAVNGTTLTYDPPVAGAPTTLNKGQFVMFNTSENFVVKSQDANHPFYVGGHMMGVYSQGSLSRPGGSFKIGDPDWVNVIPPPQYLAKYIFFADPTMGNTNIVLTRKQATDGTFKDVKLDCMAANVTGWQPVGTGGKYELARVDLAVGGASVGACNNGLHEIHSDEPFGLTVWGMDWAVSYAYPGGALVQQLNTVLVDPTTPN